MDLAHFSHNVLFHRTCANAFMREFIRLKSAGPTALELAVLENAPLCLSGMRLEILEARFRHAKTWAEIESEFEFMSNEVAAARPLLQSAYEALAFYLGHEVDTSSTRTYLELEEELLPHARRRM